MEWLEVIADREHDVARAERVLHLFFVAAPRGQPDVEGLDHRGKNAGGCSSRMGIRGTGIAQPDEISGTGQRLFAPTGGRF